MSSSRAPQLADQRVLTRGVEAGCDEAGRGPLAGPVCAAVVILPPSFRHHLLRDSKLLTERQREQMRGVIEREALAWRVAFLEPRVIDALNILQATMLAMSLALDSLPIRPELLLVDGNYFHTESNIPYQCHVGGDKRYASIAAASILAKTHRDQRMRELHKIYPHYGWDTNKGYPTAAHRAGIARYGITPQHRLSFGMGKK